MNVKEKNAIKSTLLEVIDSTKGEKSEKDLIRSIFDEIDFGKKLTSSRGDMNIANHRYVSLDEDAERSVFKGLFSFDRAKEIFHYTSINNCLSILKSGKLRLSSIVGMNDKLEMFYNDPELFQKRPLSSKRVEFANKRFILACSMRKDDLNQWRLYGDDGKGVCLRFYAPRSAKENSFLLGKVRYSSLFAAIFNELNIKLKENNIEFLFAEFFKWKSFFKNKDFMEEEEVRMYVYNMKKEMGWDINSLGILNPYLEFDLNELPLKLTGVILGPRVIESAIQKKQFEYFVKTQKKESIDSIKIEESKKLYYRK